VLIKSNLTLDTKKVPIIIGAQIVILLANQSKVSNKANHFLMKRITLKSNLISFLMMNYWN